MRAKTKANNLYCMDTNFNLINVAVVQNEATT